jgi:nucleoside-diphosphate-sugar epimerase
LGCERSKGTEPDGVVALDGRRLLQALRNDDVGAIVEHVGLQAQSQTWLYCAGINNPASAPDDVEWVNVEAPRRLFLALSDAARSLGLPSGALRLVTFGSALEDRHALAAANPYIRSKARLFQEFSNIRNAQTRDRPVAWSHIRLHTLYGVRRPPSFMFLGQMEAALRHGTEFAMSAGGQLREYHHVDDVAFNVMRYLDELPRDALSDVSVLSYGRPIRISDLATRVFAHFGRLAQLRIGARAAQIGEMFEVLPRSVSAIAERDPVEGIIAWLSELGITPAAP